MTENDRCRNPPSYRDGEREIALQSAAGREMLRVLDEARRKQSGEARLNKVFELTEMTRAAMRAGIKQQFPDLTDEQHHQIYLDRLLEMQGIDRQQMLRKHAESRSAEDRD